MPGVGVDGAGPGLGAGDGDGDGDGAPGLGEAPGGEGRGAGLGEAPGGKGAGDPSGGKGAGGGAAGLAPGMSESLSPPPQAARAADANKAVSSGAWPRAKAPLGAAGSEAVAGATVVERQPSPSSATSAVARGSSCLYCMVLSGETRAVRRARAHFTTSTRGHGNTNVTKRNSHRRGLQRTCQK